MLCPVCEAASAPFREVDGFAYFKCSSCGILHLPPDILRDIDAGKPLRTYEVEYWDTEMQAAGQRAAGPGMARLCEAIFLASTPVRAVLDIGTGPGVLLDHMARLMPHAAPALHGVELFPPPERWRTTSPNYHIGTLGSLAPMTFEAGLCMEVIEHLTPRMVANLLRALASVASEGSCFLFNTGLTPFVEHEDPAYLDPLGRGHITIWTAEAMARLAAPFGLTASPLPGRSWAFIVEKAPRAMAFEHRLYHPLPENLAFLSGGDAVDSVPSLLARSGLAWFFFADMAASRTAWAQSLDRELAALREARQPWWAGGGRRPSE